LFIAYFNSASAQGENISDMKKQISPNEDTRMNSQHLAFFLTTHNYNADPKDSYVELNLNGNRDRYHWPGFAAMRRSIKLTCAKFQIVWNEHFARRAFGPI
jgi:hypothetical protein